MGPAAPTAPPGESESGRRGRWGSGPGGDDNPLSHTGEIYIYIMINIMINHVVIYTPMIFTLIDEMM